MEPQTDAAALVELLARLAGARGAGVLLSGDELALWPAGAVQALRNARVLAPASPAVSVVCPGCERACAMPVEVPAGSGAVVRPFIACDKRDDIGRVPLVPSMLERWRCGADTLADTLARELGSGSAVRLTGASVAWRLGVVAGQHGRAVAMMRVDTEGPAVELAGHRLDMATLLSVQGSVLVIDRRRLARCADNPIEGTGAGESPEQRRARLKKRVAVVKAGGVKGFLKAVAAEEGLSVSRLKQLLVDEAPAAPTWAAPLMPGRAAGGTGSKKTARKR